jgi:hypothetical protein
MSLFESQTLMWKGETYVIPSNRMLGAIATIEEHLTVNEMVVAAFGRPSMVKIARAFGALLRYAGCKVSDDEVYQSIFDPQANHVERIQEALAVFLMIMTPPADLTHSPAMGAASGNRSAASKPSKRSIKRRSASAAG